MLPVHFGRYCKLIPDLAKMSNSKVTRLIYEVAVWKLFQGTSQTLKHTAAAIQSCLLCSRGRAENRRFGLYIHQPLRNSIPRVAGTTYYSTSVPSQHKHRDWLCTISRVGSTQGVYQGNHRCIAHNFLPIKFNERKIRDSVAALTMVHFLWKQLHAGTVESAHLFGSASPSLQKCQQLWSYTSLSPLSPYIYSINPF